ncbi:MAG: hypothetical protein HYW26_00515 [Candidatus Aenigmarchaeota archaeon]|nr:hypothetical protein [Candidatus Aenigmarchaeota archaeon]
MMLNHTPRREGENKQFRFGILCVALLLSFIFFASLAHAAVPNTMNFQAKLTDTSNVLLTDTYNFTFRIFNVVSGGTYLWSENQVIYVDNGIVNALLGNNTLLNLSFDESYWLEIRIGSETLTPRRQLATSAYAFRANVSDDLVCTSCVGSGDIATNAVTTSKITNDAVTSAKLADDLSLEGNLSAASSLLFVNNQSRFAGINTTAPTQTLTSVGTLNVTNNAGILGLFQDANARVGIGAASPITNLDIRGNANASGFLNATVLQSIGNTYLATSTGSVGVGTSLPLYTLDVRGNINASGFLNASQICFRTDCRTEWPSAISGWATTATLVYNDTAGVNVSIGSSSAAPAGYKVLIAGSVNITGILNASSLADSIVTSGAIATNAVTASKITAGAVTSAKLAQDLTLEGNLSAGSNIFYVSNNTRAVGINTTSPTQTLTVVGQANITGGAGNIVGLFVNDLGRVAINTSVPQALLHINASTTATPFRITTNANASTFVVDGGGRVGIGTASPDHKLHVFGDINATGTIYGNINATAADLECTGCVGSDDLATSAVTASKIASGAVTSAKLAQDLTIEGNLSVASSLFYVANNTRRVGVGTTSPLGPFHVTTSTVPNILVVNISSGLGVGTATPNYAGIGGLGVTIENTNGGAFELVQLNNTGSVTIGGVEGIVKSGATATLTADMYFAKDAAGDTASGYTVFRTKTASGSLTERLRITSNGSFVFGSDGIADQTLDVTGGGYISGSLGVGTASPLGIIHAARGDGNNLIVYERTGGNAGRWNTWISEFGAGSRGSLWFESTVSTGDFVIRNSAVQDVFYVDTTPGFTGINLTAPQALLHLNASSTVNSFRISTNTNPTAVIVNGTGSLGLGLIDPRATLEIANRSATDAFGTNLTAIQIDHQSENAPWLFLSDPARVTSYGWKFFHSHLSGDLYINRRSNDAEYEVIRFTRDSAKVTINGSVGINTTTSTALLALNPAANVVGLNITGTGTQANHYIYVQSSTGSPVFLVNSTGVGIGTGSPNTYLSGDPNGLVISTSFAASNRAALVLVGNRGSADNSEALARIRFANNESGNPQKINAEIAAVMDATANVNSSNLVFYTHPPGTAGGAPTERMRINSTGSVGINDSTPDGVFDVDVSGTPNALVVTETGAVSIASKTAFKVKRTTSVSTSSVTIFNIDNDGPFGFKGGLALVQGTDAADSNQHFFDVVAVSRAGGVYNISSTGNGAGRAYSNINGISFNLSMSENTYNVAVTVIGMDQAQ